MVLNSRKNRNGSRLELKFMDRMAVVLLSSAIGMFTLCGGCTIRDANMGNTLGARTYAPGESRPELWREPDRWVLIQNPRFLEDDPSQRKEPPYVWAEKDKLPLTLNKLVGGEAMILAPPEIQEKFKGDKVRPK